MHTSVRILLLWPITPEKARYSAVSGCLIFETPCFLENRLFSTKSKVLDKIFQSTVNLIKTAYLRWKFKFLLCKKRFRYHTVFFKSSQYTHRKKAACNCTDRPYAVWSRILLLNFCNSIDKSQGNQCRAWSIVIVQYTFTTSHRKISFDSSVWNCQWTYKNRAVCLSILIIPKQFDRISITGIILQILLLYHFR